MVSVCNKNFKNIMTNSIPHVIETCDDKDAPWINSIMKKSIHERNNFNKYYHKNIDTQFFEKLTLIKKYHELSFRHVYETHIHIQTQIRKNFILPLAIIDFL